MVVTKQTRIHDRLGRRLLNALGLSLLVLLLTFLFTPAFEPEPYARAEEHMELVQLPDPVPEPRALPVDRRMPRPTPELDFVEEPGENAVDPEDFDWDTVPPPVGTPGDVRVGWRQPVLQARPVALYRVSPRYPSLAREAELSGTVFLELLVDERGVVIDARDLGSTVPALLVAEALRAARQWRFEPARQHLKPVRSLVRLTFDFKISGSR